MFALAREDGVGWAVGDDPTAGLDHDHAVDQRQQIGNAVLDHDHRYITALGDAREDRAYGARAVGVEVRSRLVEEQHARPEGEDPRDGEALLLAAGERGGGAVLGISEANVGERAVNSRPYLGARDAVVLEAEGDVIAGARHDELRLGVLEHQARTASDVELALLLAAGRIEEARERQEERALPGAGRS